MLRALVAVLLVGCGGGFSGPDLADARTIEAGEDADSPLCGAGVYDGPLKCVDGSIVVATGPATGETLCSCAATTSCVVAGPVTGGVEGQWSVSCTTEH